MGLMRSCGRGIALFRREQEPVPEGTVDRSGRGRDAVPVRRRRRRRSIWERSNSASEKGRIRNQCITIKGYSIFYKIFS